MLGPAFQHLQVTIPVAAEVDRCLGVWGSYAGHQWRPEPGLGPLCALRKAQGVLTLADVWVPNIKDNGGREGRQLFIIPKRFLMKRRPLVLLSGAWVLWRTSLERKGVMVGARSSATLGKKGKNLELPRSTPSEGNGSRHGRGQRQVWQVDGRQTRA